MNPFVPRDQAAALESLRDLVRRSADDVRLRLWLDRALADYASGQAVSLDEALGLPSPAARRRALRERARLTVLDLVLGAAWPPDRTLTYRVRRLAAQLQGDLPLSDEKDLRSILAPFELPKSERQLWTLLREQRDLP